MGGGFDSFRDARQTQPNGKTSISPLAPFDHPVRLKLGRSGNLFTAYAAADGQEWIWIGEPVTVGLAVTTGNRDGSRHHEARFDQAELK